MAYSSEAVAGTAQAIAFLRYEPRGLPPARYGRLIVAVGFNPREDAYAPRVASRRLNIRVSSPAMANTFSQVYLHLVFSTKDRVDLIAPEIEQRVWSYMGGVAKKHGTTPLQIGGTDNHAHALIGVPTSISPAEAAKYIKGDSSKWLRAELIPNFGWQDGYGAFSVSKSSILAVAQYIQNQRAHHAKQSFEDEFVELLNLHEITYDERYLFG